MVFSILKVPNKYLAYMVFVHNIKIVGVKLIVEVSA